MVSDSKTLRALTNNTLLWRRRDDQANMSMLVSQLFVQAEEIAEPPLNGIVFLAEHGERRL